jgi:hypothetical protein
MDGPAKLLIPKVHRRSRCNPKWRKFRHCVEHSGEDNPPGRVAARFAMTKGTGVLSGIAGSGKRRHDISFFLP